MTFIKWLSKFSKVWGECFLRLAIFHVHEHHGAAQINVAATGVGEQAKKRGRKRSFFGGERAVLRVGLIRCVLRRSGKRNTGQQAGSEPELRDTVVATARDEVPALGDQPAVRWIRLEGLEEDAAAALWRMYDKGQVGQEFADIKMIAGGILLAMLARAASQLQSGTRTSLLTSIGAGLAWSLADGLRFYYFVLLVFAAATSAATSMQRTLLVAPLRTPVTGECMEPDTSGATITLPATTGTLETAISIASCSASFTSCGTSAPTL